MHSGGTNCIAKKKGAKPHQTRRKNRQKGASRDFCIDVFLWHTVLLCHFCLQKTVADFREVLGANHLTCRHIHRLICLISMKFQWLDCSCVSKETRSRYGRKKHVLINLVKMVQKAKSTQFSAFGGGSGTIKCFSEVFWDKACFIYVLADLRWWGSRVTQRGREVLLCNAFGRFWP